MVPAGRRKKKIKETRRQGDKKRRNQYTHIISHSNVTNTQNYPIELGNLLNKDLTKKAFLGILYSIMLFIPQIKIKL
jgi:hypothetical protein